MRDTGSAVVDPGVWAKLTLDENNAISRKAVSRGFMMADNITASKILIDTIDAKHELFCQLPFTRLSQETA